MGDGDHRARILLEVALEPGHGFRIQVVRGLVEEQHVRLLQQEAAQGHAADLAARQRRDVGIPRGNAERVHGDLDGAVEIPAIGGLDGVLHPGLLLEQLLHLIAVHRLAEAGIDLVEARQESPHLAHAFFDIAAHVLGGVQARLLGQIADLDAIGRPRLAEEVLVHARHDAQERALACPVRAEDADLGAGIEGKPDTLQDLPLGGNDLFEVLHGEDELMSHGSPRIRCVGFGARRGLGATREPGLPSRDYTQEVFFRIDKRRDHSL
jgi:hypothetical protein